MKKEKPDTHTKEQDIGDVQDGAPAIDTPVPDVLQADELSSTKEQLLRCLAEYDNYRKRSTREREVTFTNGVSYAAQKLLPILDALLMASTAPCNDEEYKKGIEMLVSKGKDIFEAIGITEIVAQDELFDPELHAAVMQQQSDKPPGTVLSVLQPGYRCGDKVVRHATVVVSE